MGAIIDDFRLALRAVARSPGYAAIAVVTLALGIGATTAIFSVVNGALPQRRAFDAGTHGVRGRLRSQGNLLQRREQQILEIVTQKVD